MAERVFLYTEQDNAVIREYNNFPIQSRPKFSRIQTENVLRMESTHYLIQSHNQWK